MMLYLRINYKTHFEMGKIHSGIERNKTLLEMQYTFMIYLPYLRNYLFLCLFKIAMTTK
jgi:hypothetical protein